MLYIISIATREISIEYTKKKNQVNTHKKAVMEEMREKKAIKHRES